MSSTTRPDMRDYFRGRIDWHVNGMMARNMAPLPRDVVRIDGDVDDSVITVKTKDGSIWTWKGGQYAARKVNGCYAPKMPTPIKD